jgi:SAM-dependent methyltransferase
MATFISKRETQFSYFDRLLGRPVWQGRKILDFGGNVGGFLLGADGNVAHEDYWCLDLNRGAIEQGHRALPRAHFRHYDRYSAFFNPEGVRRLPVPDLGQKFDIILAFSVFTHTHRSEMIELVSQLRQKLAPGGRLRQVSVRARAARGHRRAEEPGMAARHAPHARHRRPGRDREESKLVRARGRPLVRGARRRVVRTRTAGQAGRVLLLLLHG